MTPLRRSAICVLVLGTLALATACGGAQGSANSPDGRGAAVRTWKGDPPSNCKELGIVEAAAQACSVACQIQKMKDAAAELGGNSLRIDYTSGGSAASGTAFDCPGQPSLASADEADEASEPEAADEETESSDTDDDEDLGSDESEY